ncbi:MAG: hypothetical protein ACAI25_17830 [Planctomycetota bacterium]
MSRLFYRGEIPWTKACVAAAEAAEKPETEAAWCERAVNETRESLERRARAEAGLPNLNNFSTKLTDEQQAWFNDAFAAIQRERGEAVDRAVVLAEACRRLVQGGAVAGGPRPLVAIGVCAKCDEATHGTDTQSAEKVSALCNVDIVDLTTNPPTRSRSIPADVAARVLARDQAKCRVPGCGNKTWIDIHHEGGVRNVGHDPEKMITLCRSCHDARHDGLLQIVFESGRAIFSLADGEIVGEAVLRVLPGGSNGGTEGCAKVVYPGKRQAQEMSGSPGIEASDRSDRSDRLDAQRALVALGIDAREAARLIANAGPCATTELLVKEALRRRPVSA